MEKGNKLYTCFIDFSKVFDYVVHDNLWYKLLKIGIRGKIFNILHSMYENIKTRVFCDGVKSEPFYCQLGVRQGECLSPFLFAKYINDLEMYLSANNSGITASHMKMFLLLYADDTRRIRLGNRSRTYFSVLTFSHSTGPGYQAVTWPRLLCPDRPERTGYIEGATVFWSRDIL